MQKASLNALFVTLQGTLTMVDGRFVHHSEYPEDQDVYIEHLLWVVAKVREIQPDIVVACGGRSRKETPSKSEARSFLEFCSDACGPRFPPVILEDVSLDSSENVWMAAMGCRMMLEGLLVPVHPGGDDHAVAAAMVSNVKGQSASEIETKPKTSFDRITILPAWRFKHLRFSLVATALMLDHFEICAFAEAHSAKASEAACWGEAKAIAEISSSRDALLMADVFEDKRRRRFAGSDSEYQNRLNGLRRIFPDTFKQYDILRAVTKGSEYNLSAFREAFHKEVTQ